MFKPGTLVELTENCTVERGKGKHPRRVTFAFGQQFEVVMHDRVNGVVIAKDAAGVKWSLPAERLERVTKEKDKKDDEAA